MALRSPASVVLPGGQLREVRMCDIASDGASVLSQRPIPQGSSLELRVRLPGGAALTSVATAARVVYSSYISPGEFKVGLAFQQVDADSAAAIHAFVG
jgi:hypothetical protein